MILEPTPTVFTIGHSTHSTDGFLRLLQQHGITAIADVRSSPFSRYNPQFNKEVLEHELKVRGIQYVFLGKELGARPDDPLCYKNGLVSFTQVAGTVLFQNGLNRVLDGARKFRIALMCAEKDPLECHRTILVAHALVARGATIIHILSNGQLESYEETLPRLLKLTKVPAEDLFKSHDELVEEAFSRQADRIAFSDDHLNPEDTGENP